MNEPFKEIEHSGDIGIEARGGDLRSLFRNAALGLFSLMVRGEVGSGLERGVVIRSQGLEALLVDWLSEIIAVSSAYGELYSDAVIEKIGDFFLEATLRGEGIDTDKHDLRFEVKAATYHELMIENDAGGFRARVIFDL